MANKKGVVQKGTIRINIKNIFQKLLLSASFVFLRETFENKF